MPTQGHVEEKKLEYKINILSNNKTSLSGEINGGATWPRDLVQRFAKHRVKVGNSLFSSFFQSCRWDGAKLGSEERLHFASCLTFCVQTTLLRVATLPLSTLVSSSQAYFQCYFQCTLSPTHKINSIIFFFLFLHLPHSWLNEVN